jgi:hypothetical protein
MKVYLDSVIIIYYLDHVGDFQVRAARRLAALHAAEDEIVISDLVRMECRVDPIRKSDNIRLARFDGFLSVPMYKLCLSRRLSSTEPHRFEQHTATRRLIRSIWQQLLKLAVVYF